MKIQFRYILSLVGIGLSYSSICFIAVKDEGIFSLRIDPNSGSHLNVWLVVVFLLHGAIQVFNTTVHIIRNYLLSMYTFSLHLRIYLVLCIIRKLGLIQEEGLAYNLIQH